MKRCPHLLVVISTRSLILLQLLLSVSFALADWETKRTTLSDAQITDPFYGECPDIESRINFTIDLPKLLIGSWYEYGIMGYPAVNMKCISANYTANEKGAKFPISFNYLGFNNHKHYWTAATGVLDPDPKLSTKLELFFKGYFTLFLMSFTTNPKYIIATDNKRYIMLYCCQKLYPEGLHIEYVSVLTKKRLLGNNEEDNKVKEEISENLVRYKLTDMDFQLIDQTCDGLEGVTKTY